jgi:hypothetical protein
MAAEPAVEARKFEKYLAQARKEDKNGLMEAVRALIRRRKL